MLLTGCAFVASPQPPTLWLPAPVKDLTAKRLGNEVHLHWMMPRNTTDKVALKGDQRAHICWMDGQAPAFDPRLCQTAGDAPFAPDKPADFTAQLSQKTATGAPRAVRYFVELRNHAGKTAGPSNAAWVAAGAAPASVTGLQLGTQAAGVVLHWEKTATAPDLVMRIHRTLVQKPGAATPSEANGAPLQEQQTLEVSLSNGDPGGAVDHDAALDHVWKYTAERVRRVEMDRHALEITGSPSDTVTIVAKDIFPPAVPGGLTAIADTHAHAIALSWAPDTDADIAGYIVYRRDMTAGTSIERIAGASLVVPPSFVDRKVLPGHRYAYAVSAVDQDGNESARSAEAEEELPE